MVGIHTFSEDSVLAGVDQLDLLGLDKEVHCNESLAWLRKRAKHVTTLLHPDGQLRFFPEMATKLPYRDFQANAVGEFLQRGIVKVRSDEPAEDLILHRFWYEAEKGHRRRWYPFDENDQLRKLKDSRLLLLDSAKEQSNNLKPSHDTSPDTPWSGERERRPYSTSFQQKETTTFPTPASEHLSEDVTEPLATEPLTEKDDAIHQCASRFSMGKLFSLAGDAAGVRFVIGRTRLRIRGGKQAWALVTAHLNAKDKLVLCLLGKDVTRKGTPVVQKLNQGSRISWDRMQAGGFYGFGHFKHATREQIYEAARSVKVEAIALSKA